MQTEYIKLDPEHMDKAALKKGALLLRQGEVVAFPTETVYGLGANALDPAGVDKIFLAKGRPGDNPLIVHVAHPGQLKSLVTEIPPGAYALMERFWPGPLTLIFPKSSLVPSNVTGGLNTVALRMPKHPIALALLQEAGVPVAAPSANLSGKPSPTVGEHVWTDLMGKIPLILDGGETQYGVESTVLDLTATPPMILRPGGVTLEEIQEVIGEVRQDPALKENQPPRSPGMKYTHYAPEAEVLIMEGSEQEITSLIVNHYQRLVKTGQKIALLVSEETAQELEHQLVPDYLEILGPRKNLSLVAHRLFSALRHADLHSVDLILIEAFSDQGLGAAVMNRMRKAAGNKVLKS
ncbi:L-threonylcarbamoyladenylate synthase [Dehalobacterium formicoaceticum]|uniref:L-threonylcarbamoyladenylate synthase n=1 Tax=Dehalobacterium formicoaceticum TaxID=51515 RepID=UPI0031F692D2